MSIRVVRLEDMQPQPWKNGGGRTRELLAWPGPQDWWLRISVADIESDGPFSAYPGVNRWFGVLEGDGVELTWPHAVRHLHAGHSLLNFDGGEPPDCKLVGSKTRDLNVMHRRQQGRVTVQRAHNGSRVPAGFPHFALFTLEPVVLQRAVEGPLQVPAWSMVWGDCAGEQLQARGEPHAWWVAFGGAAA